MMFQRIDGIDVQESNFQVQKKIQGQKKSSDAGASIDFIKDNLEVAQGSICVILHIGGNGDMLEGIQR